MPARIRAYVRHHHLALLALFVALGGTSYAATRIPANSVGSRQIKNQAVTLKKVSPSAQKALRGHRGPQGPQGLQGGQGATGEGATKLFALIGESGFDLAVLRSSGGVTVAADSGSGYRVTFPRDISTCVALANESIDNGSATPINPLETSIKGSTVDVTSSGGYRDHFAVAVFC
jgi:hypothetical protein